MMVIREAIARKRLLKELLILRKRSKPKHLPLGAEGERVFNRESLAEHGADVVFHPRQEYRVGSSAVLASDLRGVAGQVKSANTVFEEEKPRIANGQCGHAPKQT